MPNQTNIDERFYMRQGETPEQYMARTRAYFGSGNDATIGTLYNAPKPNKDYETGIETYKKYTSPINERKIRRNTIAQFQKEIDAYNQIYAQKLAEVKQQGIGRLGSARAIQARSGLLGSDFGSAQTTKVEDANSELENLVRSELSAKISEIMGRANKAATEDIAAKRTAQEQGVEKYLEYLGKKSETIKSNVNALALDLYNKGITPTSVGENTLAQIAKSYGTDVATIKAAFDETKITQDTAKEKADLENKKIKAEIAKGKYQTIGDGAYLYNTETGQTIINPQDFSPNTGGGAGISGLTYTEGENAAVDSWIKNIKTGKAKFSDIKDKPTRDLVSQGLAVVNAKTDLSDGYKIASELLDRDTDTITGIKGPTAYLPGTDAQYTQNLTKQLAAYLALENRQKLKGSGAISDFESRVLNSAASALGIDAGTGRSSLGNADFKKELRKVKGVLGSLSGVSVSVKVTDPNTGETKIGPLSREEINDAFAQGYAVEYQ